jgi:HD-GYP domain-containing protein (c-di-GMP phosphodiesterase class II)
MTTDRPYRKGMPPWQALEEIVKNTGKQFDPEIVEVFKRVISGKTEHV